MNRTEQVARYNKNWEDAMQAAKAGETIDLSALIGGAEEIHIDDLDKRTDRKSYSDGWKVKGGIR